MRRRIHRGLLHLFRLLPTRGRRAVVRTIAPKFTVGSICIIERADGRMLFVCHTYRKRWGTPGGLLKRGEDPDDAARREVLEEVALAVELDGEPAVVVDAERQRIDVVYRAFPAAGADPDAIVPSSPEIADARWFAPDDLPELQHETTTALIALARARSPQEPERLRGRRASRRRPATGDDPAYTDGAAS